MHVSDKVRLIRNKTIPMIKVMMEVIEPLQLIPQFGMNVDHSKSGLIKSDIIYIAPTKDKIPERLIHIEKARCTSINYENPQNQYQPNLQGEAHVNIKNVPNGRYNFYLLRISEPVSIESIVKVVSKAENINVNIDRTIINQNVRGFRKFPL